MSKQPEYIERKALIESFRSVAEGVGDSPWTIEAIEAMIERQEAEEVEPVRCGRWIVRHKGGNNWVDCSECATVGSPHWKRCPVCEAKMVGGKE